MTTQTKKQVFFVATRKRDEPVVVHFYTKKGEPVAFRNVQKVKTKKGVFFYTKPTRVKTGKR